MHRSFLLSLLLLGACNTDAERHGSGRQPNTSFCADVGPACGLTVDFEGGRLDVGVYAITVDTPAGLTSCDYVVGTPTHQDREAAEAADQALADCQANGTCDTPCTGPEIVHLRSSGLTIEGDSEALTVVVENVETGARAEKSFSPTYEDHPLECAACVIAADAMPLPGL